jgi:hypothetical protein
MRPIKGLVVGIVKSNLTIELEIGLTIHYQKSGIELYDKVLVYYNFQNLKVTDVILEKTCMPGIHQHKSIEGYGALETEDDGVSITDYGLSGSDYGALETEDDGVSGFDEFSGLDYGALEPFEEG